MKLFYKITFILLLTAGSIILILSRDNRVYDYNNYFGALIDKNHLLENTPSPRMIFVGASNLAFGLNSKKIEDEFKMPVINMGLHGDLGLSFILNDVKHNIKQGDIVVLSIEYFLDKIYYKDLSYTVALYPKGKEFIDYDKDYYIQKTKYYVNEAQQIRQKFFNFVFEKIIRLQEAKVYVSSELNSYDTLVYSRSAFNSNGDVVSHIDKKPLENLNGRNNLEIVDYIKCIEKLNEFLKYANDNGARVYFTYASYPQSEYEKNYKAVSDFENQLKDNMKIEIISSPEDSVFPDSLFFDSVYHLNRDGREIRTDKIIKALKEKVFHDQKY